MRFAGMVVVLATAGGCSTMEVTVDFNPKVQFSGLRDWAFKEQQAPLSRDPRLQGRRLDQRIQENIERRLVARGLPRVSVEEADFLVGYAVRLRQALALEADDDTYESTPAMVVMGAARPPEPGTTHTFDEGSLAIEFLEPGRGRMLWRAWTSAEVDLAQEPAHNQGTLEQAIEHILEEFPPRGKRLAKPLIPSID